MSDITFISIFNEGCLELALNHLDSLKKQGINNYVAYVTDKESYNRLLGSYNVILIDGTNTTNDKKDFNSEDFNKLSYVRYYVIREYLTKNQPIWYMDIDTVVLKNLNDKYAELLNNYKNYQLDALFQSDINAVCTGCMLLFPTNNTKKMIQTIIDERISNANDQMLLNYLLDQKKISLSYDLFKLSEFPVGYLYFNNEDCVPVGENLSEVIKAKNRYLVEEDKIVYFVHANWIIGNSNKMKVLKKYNLWFS